MFVFSHCALGYPIFSLSCHPGCFKALGIFDSSACIWINTFLMKRLNKVVVRMVRVFYKDVLNASSKPK